MRFEQRLRRMRLRLRAVFRRAHVERELDEEIRYHLARQTDEYIARGLTAEDARRAALRRFGGVEQIKEQSRDVQGVRLVHDLVQDLRYAVRLLRRSPGFTAVALLSLALGIGATTAIVTIVHSILTRPLPFPDSARLVWVWNAAADTPAKETGARMSQFRTWQSSARVYDGFAAWNAFFSHSSYNLTGRGEPERLSGLEVSQTLFPLLGARPFLGRVFADGEDLPGAAPVVILSYGLWQRRFGGDRHLVGASLMLNERPYTVVGVLPADFPFTTTFVPGTELDLYFPLIREDRAERLGFFLAVIGRLRPGATPDQARAELASLQQGLAVARPFMASYRQDVIPLARYVARGVRTPLLILPHDGNPDPQRPGLRFV